MRMLVMSSSFNSRSTSSIESINPEDTKAVFSSMEMAGFRIRRTMCSTICCSAEVMRTPLLSLVAQFGMLLQKLFATGRPCRLSSRAFHNPLRWLQKNSLHCNTQSRNHPATNVSLKLFAISDQFFALDFCHQDNFFRAEAVIVNA